jgi:hypothetical protein
MPSRPVINTLICTNTHARAEVDLNRWWFKTSPELSTTLTSHGIGSTVICRGRAISIRHYATKHSFTSPFTRTVESQRKYGCSFLSFHIAFHRWTSAGNLVDGLNELATKHWSALSYVEENINEPPPFTGIKCTFILREGELFLAHHRATTLLGELQMRSPIAPHLMAAVLGPCPDQACVESTCVRW